MTTSAKPFEPKLKDGVVGREIVAYFLNLDGSVAVEAKSLGALSRDEHDYEITFESGVVRSYRITWGKEFRFQILYVAPLS